MRLSRILVFILLSTNFLFAQDSVKSTNYALQDGKWALQFQVAQNFQLGAFNGATVALKRQTSNVNAQRMSFTISSSINNHDDGSTSSDTSQRRSNSANNDQSIMFSYTFQHYILDGEDIHPYFGFGPIIGMGRSHSENSTNVTEPHYWLNSSSEYNNTSLTVGGMAFLGAEWFVSRSISVSAEYTFTATYSSSSGSTETSSESQSIQSYGTNYYHTKSKSDGSGNSFGFGGSKVLFGLSVYF